MDQMRSAEDAVEEACIRAEEWFQTLPPFPDRVNLGSVVGHKFPALLSEQDCVIHFARFLNESGLPWDAIHHQVSVSRWLFEPPHPAATAGASKWRWRADLTILDSERFLAASLPATEPSFQFDACLEFAYLSDFWTLPHVHPYGYPEKGRKKVLDDVSKVARYLEIGACRSGYVIVFAECDPGLPSTFVEDSERDHGCQVRFIRGYS